MLSTKVLKSADNAQKYYSHADYYGEEAKGVWYGSGNKDFGLEGSFDPKTDKQFNDLLRGKMPDGSVLGKLDKNGKLIHRAGADFTFSSPKSISIKMHVLGKKCEKEALIGARDRALKKTLDYIERSGLVYTRKGKGGKIKEPVKNLNFSLFTHTTNRNSEPHDHTHCFVPNAVKCADGKYRTVVVDDVLKDNKFYGQVFRNYLALERKGIGEEIRTTLLSDGSSSFELKDTSQNLIDGFSTRRKEIEELFEKYGAVTKKARDRIVINSRKTKKTLTEGQKMELWSKVIKNIIEQEKSKPPEPLRDRVAEEIRGFLDKNLYKSDVDRIKKPADVTVDEIKQCAVNSITYNYSTFSERGLNKAALKYGIGKYDIDDIEGSSKPKDVIQSKVVDEKGKKQDLFTTKELLAKEKEILKMGKSGQDKCTALIKEKQFVKRFETYEKNCKKGFKLNSQQKRAVKHIVTSKDKITAIEGLPGVGKSTVLEVVRKMVGNKVDLFDKKSPPSKEMLGSKNKVALFGLAPTASAAKTLEKSSGIKSKTIHWLVGDKGKYRGYLEGRGAGSLAERQNKFKNSICVIDEASLMGTNQAHDILRLSELFKFRILLIGDRGQLGSAEAGKDFVQLLEKKAIKSVKLTRIVRQEKEEHKEATLEAASNKILKSFKIHEESIKGSKHFVTQAIRQYVFLSEQEKDNTVLISPSRKYRDKINQGIVKHLTKEGILKEQTHKLDILKKIDLSKSDYGRACSYKEDYLVKFNKAYTKVGIEKGDMLKVSEANQTFNTLLFKKGFRNVRFQLKHGTDYAGKLEVFKTDTLDLQEGMRLRITKNANGFVNSETVKIKNIDNENDAIKVQLEDKSHRTVSFSKLRHVDFGYCSTVHAAEGKTSQKTIAALGKHSILNSHKFWLVITSRHKSDLYVYTQDKEKVMQQTINNEGIEKSALDIIKPTVSSKQPKQEITQAVTLTSKYISRDEGRSIVGVAAYRSGAHLVEKLLNKATGSVVEKEFNYTNKTDVTFSEVFLPETASKWMGSRQDLWNHIELLENRENSRLAREVELGLPRELDQEQNIELLRKYVKECFVDKGMVADVNVHWEKDNPHAYILLPTRNIEGDRFGVKNSDWDKKSFALNLSKMWTNHVSRCVKQHNLDRGLDTSYYGFNQPHSFKKGGLYTNRSTLTFQKFFDSQEAALKATVHEDTVEGVRLNKEIREENAKRVIDNPGIIIDLVASSHNIFSKSEIATEIFNILERSQSFTGNEHFESVLNNVLSHKRLQVVTEQSVNKEELYTTIERDKVEKALWNSVESLQNSKSHKVNFSSLSDGLSQQQKEAVVHLTREEGISLLVGRAGTGKSFLMKEVASIYEKNGYRIMGGAVSGIATNNLAEACGTKVGDFRTLAGWSFFLRNSDLEGQGNKSYFDSKSVFIIDEASMVDMNDLAYLANKINEAGGKLIVVGDPEQLQAIGIIGTFKVMINKIGAFELNQIWRQEEEWQREATLNIAKGEVREALLQYGKNGSIKFCETKVEARNNLVRAYVDESIQGNKEGIILAYTRKTVSLLNKEIRNHLVQAGELVEVNGAKYKTSEGVISIACGEQVVFTRNNPSLGIYNGTRAIVEQVSSSNKELQGELTFRVVGENRKITIDTSQYNNFVYGYAITIHKSQSLNIKDTYLLVEEYMGYNSLYVGASRHISNLYVFADKETFRDLDELGRVFERDYKGKGLIDDYAITPERLEYFNRVHSYNDIRQETANEYCKILDDIKKSNILFSDHPGYEDFLGYIGTREKKAQEIYTDLEKHSVFLTQAGIKKTMVAKHAGVELQELESESKILLAKEYNKLFDSLEKSKSEKSKNLPLGEYSVQTIYKFYQDTKGIAIKHAKHAALSEQRLSDPNLDSRWRATLQDTVKEYGKANYTSWFSKMEMGEEKKGVLTIKTPTGFIKDYLDTHYNKKLLRIAGNHFDGVKKINFEVSEKVDKDTILREQCLSGLDNNLKMDSRWKGTLKDAIKEHGEANYISWFSKMEMGEEKNEVLKIKAPTGFVRDWLDTHYNSKLLRLAKNHFDGVKKINFEVSEELKGKKAPLKQNYVEQEAAFAISQNKHLFREKELNLVEDKLQEDAQAFKTNALDKPLKSADISTAEKYVHFQELKGEEKTALAKELSNKLDGLLSQKQLLEHALKERKLEVLHAQEEINTADYKERLLCNFLKKTYKEPSVALDKWQALKQKRGQDGALLEIKKNFRVLGVPKSKGFLETLDGSEVKLGETLSSKFLSHEQAQEKKQQSEKVLNKYSKESIIEKLENKLLEVKRELSWLPENSRVMNEIKNEAVKDIAKAHTLEAKETKLTEIDYHNLNASVGKTLDKISKLRNQIEKTEHENKQLTLKFSSVYRTDSQSTLYRWNKLVRAEGLEKAESILNNDREFLGKLRGKSNLLGIVKDKERQFAIESSHLIGSNLRKYTENNDKIDKINFAIETTKDKETNIKLEKDMSSVEIQKVVFESEYKKTVLEQGKSPNLNQLKEITNTSHCAAKYALKYKDDLDQYTSRSIVKTINSELNREKAALDVIKPAEKINQPEMSIPK